MNSFEKLQKKLAELFQLDQTDLDFGNYRIMNARREEIIEKRDKLIEALEMQQRSFTEQLFNIQWSVSLRRLP